MTLSFSDMTEHVINKEITVSASAPSNIAIVKYWGKRVLRNLLIQALALRYLKLKPIQTLVICITKNH